ncbi:TraR/DksA family transcriptional regulator [Streptomyces fagopyri]|uniref:TraR/DksA family transcriptional regulator n=1 Tax=Streptomyces fagopyri TaxID=2662397 RepID=UPI003676A68B
MVNNQIIGVHDTHLAPADLDLAALRENLLEQRLFRQEQLRQIAATSGAHTPLRQRAASQTEIRVQLAASARMVLADVDAALARMDEGGYGACGLCRRPIESERLAIVPQARYCARCQQVREVGR